MKNKKIYVPIAALFETQCLVETRHANNLMSNDNLSLYKEENVSRRMLTFYAKYLQYVLIFHYAYIINVVLLFVLIEWDTW